MSFTAMPPISWPNLSPSRLKGRTIEPQSLRSKSSSSRVPSGMSSCGSCVDSFRPLPSTSPSRMRSFKVADTSNADLMPVTGTSIGRSSSGCGQSIHMTASGLAATAREPSNNSAGSGMPSALPSFPDRAKRCLKVKVCFMSISFLSLVSYASLLQALLRWDNAAVPA